MSTNEPRKDMSIVNGSDLILNGFQQVDGVWYPIYCVSQRFQQIPEPLSGDPGAMCVVVIVDILDRGNPLTERNKRLLNLRGRCHGPPFACFLIPDSNSVPRQVFSEPRRRFREMAREPFLQRGIGPDLVGSESRLQPGSASTIRGLEL